MSIPGAPPVAVRPAAPPPVRSVSPGFAAWLKGQETGADARTGKLLPHSAPALTAYLCPAGKWTIGWGARGPGIVRGTVWTLWQCQTRFAADVATRVAQVAKLLGSATTAQGQFDALIGFAFNAGVPALAGSTLLACHRAGKFAAAHAEFGKWIYGHVDGRLVELSGLAMRRAVEAAFYAGGSPHA